MIVIGAIMVTTALQWLTLMMQPISLLYFTCAIPQVLVVTWATMVAVDATMVATHRPVATVQLWCLYDYFYNQCHYGCYWCNGCYWCHCSNYQWPYMVANNIGLVTIYGLVPTAIMVPTLAAIILATTPWIDWYFHNRQLGNLCPNHPNHNREWANLSF